MGMFGLGWAEIGVIGLVGVFLLGPEKLAPMAKELGKSATGLKEVTDSFAQGMAEGETGISNKGGEDAKTVEAQVDEVDNKTDV